MSTNRKESDSHRNSADRAAIRHCLIITAVALIAVAISTALPRDESAAAHPAAQAPAAIANQAISNDSTGAEYYAPSTPAP